MKYSGGNIQVVDGATSLAEQDQLVHALSKSVWRFGWPVNPAPFARQCWRCFIAGRNRPENSCCESELHSSDEWGFLGGLWARTKREYLERETLVGVYANAQTCGQDSPIHRDNRPNLRGKTVVVFCNRHWATTWGGELVFYSNDKTDVLKVVLPKPGRIVVFDGQIPHSAKAPNMNCAEPRMTLAFKTVLKEEIA